MSMFRSTKTILSGLSAIVVVIAIISLAMFGIVTALLVIAIIIPVVILFGKRIKRENETIYKFGEIELKFSFDSNSRSDEQKDNQENVK